MKCEEISEKGHCQGYLEVQVTEYLTSGSRINHKLQTLYLCVW